ncbi:unnamed protein product [Rhizopus stolonifer]
MNGTLFTIYSRRRIMSRSRVFKAKIYICKVISPCRETRKTLDLINIAIIVIGTNPSLLNPANVYRVIEYDFVAQMWLPLLESIVDVHGMLRVKVREPSPKASIVEGKRLYNEVNAGFKENNRLLYDSNHKEHDLLCFEAAKK